MNANELRIGNWVDVSGEIQVSLLDLSNIYNWKERYRGYATCPYRPIPLTEEWLVKFGFEIRESHTTDRFWKNDFLFKDGKLYIHFSMDEGDFYVECKYVHQLQNLYFDLTGEELTIKP